jgi:hypothetical protein
MAEAIYVLCAGTSIVCAFLLLRSYARTRSALLFWSGVCFVGLALNNVLLFVDLIVVPEVDLGPLRTTVAIGGMAAMVFGLVWAER